MPVRLLQSTATQENESGSDPQPCSMIRSGCERCAWRPCEVSKGVLSERRCRVWGAQIAEGGRHPPMMPTRSLQAIMASTSLTAGRGRPPAA